MKKPDDYVIATNKSYTVRKFIEETYKALGIKIKWSGKGIKEKAIDTKTKKDNYKGKSKIFQTKRGR